MKKLIYPENGKSRPLPEMLALHYSVHTSVDTSGDARWTRTRDQWMGKVVSGELHQSGVRKVTELSRKRTED